MSTLKQQVMLVAALAAATSAVAQEPLDLDGSYQCFFTQQYVSSVLPMPEGTLIVSGRMRFPGEENDKRTARLNALGGLDMAYNASGLGGGKLVAWENGLVYVATDQTVRRLSSTGFQDPEFLEMNAGPYFSSLQGGDYHVFPDGRVLMSGTHTLSDAVRGFEGMYNLIWFTNTGYLDTTRTHRYSNGNMFEFEALPDGKFICSTQGTSYEGQPVSRIFRIHDDGALDGSFSAPLDNWGWSYAFHALPNGNLLAGGTYRLDGGADTLCLIRLLPNGELDPSFHLLDIENTITQSGLPNLWCILPIAGDRFIITGRFDRIDGALRNCIAMVDADGNLIDDAFLDAGCSAYTYNGYIWHDIHGIVPAPDGSYYIHGAYRGYDDGTTNDPDQRFVSRLYGLNVGVQEHAGSRMAIYPNPASESLTAEMERSLPDGTVVILDAMGREVLRQRITGSYIKVYLNDLADGVYTLGLYSKDLRLQSERFIVQH